MGGLVTAALEMQSPVSGLPRAHVASVTNHAQPAQHFGHSLLQALHLLADSRADGFVPRQPVAVACESMRSEPQAKGGSGELYCVGWCMFLTNILVCAYSRVQTVGVRI